MYFHSRPYSSYSCTTGQRNITNNLLSVSKLTSSSSSSTVPWSMVMYAVSNILAYYYNFVLMSDVNLCDYELAARDISHYKD